MTSEDQARVEALERTVSDLVEIVERLVAQLRPRTPEDSHRDFMSRIAARRKA